MINTRKFKKAIAFAQNHSIEPVEWEVKSYHEATCAGGEVIPYELRINPHRIVMEAKKQAVLESVKQSLGVPLSIEVMSKLTVELEANFTKCVWLTNEVRVFEIIIREAENYLKWHHKRLIALANQLTQEKAQKSLNLTF